MPDETQVGQPNLSRRAFLSAAGSSAAVAAIVDCSPASTRAAERDTSTTVGDGPTIVGAVPLTLRINGKHHRLLIDPRRRAAHRRPFSRLSRQGDQRTRGARNRGDRLGRHRRRHH